MSFVYSTGQLIVDNQLELSRGISKALDKRYTSFLQESKLEDESVTQWRAQLIHYMGEALTNSSIDPVIDKVTEWARTTSIAAVNYGVSIDQLLMTTKYYRKAVWDFIKENTMYQNENRDDLLMIGQVTDSVLDLTSHIFGITFVEHHKQTLKLANKEKLAISTPIVSLSQNIAILPLIGEIDIDRAEILLESALNKCSELGNTVLIVDLSGVPMIDTFVANKLFMLTSSLKLIGVTPVITGIRPENAVAMLSLGIDFKEIQTFGSLKQVLHIHGVHIN
ncbi:STAS domain-containing protein [Paenisporosarcina sp. NPDC076898]|uniref:STAS domain-containing protein n=1 Tax=unclassified Paenisporosarcina TaxID=2642018 RepID=UPI003D022480